MHRCPGGCSASELRSRRVPTGSCPTTSTSRSGSHLRRPRLRLVLPCPARRPRPCARLPLDTAPAARQPDRNRRPGVAGKGRAAAPRRRQVRRLHLAADAEHASGRPDAPARSDTRELRPALVRAPGAAARARRRDVRRCHAARDRQACGDDRLVGAMTPSGRQGEVAVPERARRAGDEGACADGLPRAPLRSRAGLSSPSPVSSTTS
jgi:hypothetical protein